MVREREGVDMSTATHWIDVYMTMPGDGTNMFGTSLFVTNMFVTLEE